MPDVTKKYRKELDKIKNLLKKVGFNNKHNTDLTAWAILALQDEKPKQTKIGFGSLAEGASIRDLLDFCRECGTNYAENTRESVRKHSIKYLVEAHIVIRNHDDPGRPTNSAKTNYILNKEFLKIINATQGQKKLIADWNKKYSIMDPTNNWRKDKSLKVSFEEYIYQVHPSPHNFLSKIAVENFLPAISENFKIIYFSDTDDKSLHTTNTLDNFMKSKFDVHKQVPDVIAYDDKTKTLFFIEAIASSGEINDLRKKEIDKLFPIDSKINRCYVSVFMNRKEFRKFSDSIANGTEVWIVDKVLHTITFRELKI
ncbi:hypothetical protein KAI58_02945 [Candidatus Gracilibacteria bacterium]|nr:hypothetical protein [Candidatus Gracilibacteria bacterium]